MSKYVIHCDGACQGNPGPGGWAAVVAHGQDVRELTGGDPQTTNNRMELMGAIRGLQATPPSAQVHLVTDSKYVQQGITQWIKGWKAKGWITASKQPVKNQDLWQQLDQAVSGRSVTWEWVRGHAGHAGNTRADQLAREAVPRGRF